MANETVETPDDSAGSTLKDKISGAGQVILGEIETIGGVLTGDPVTRAEGEFNVEVGTVRDELEAEGERTGALEDDE